MEVTFWMEILAATIIAAILCSIVALVVKRGNDANVGIGCGLMFPVTIVLLIVICISVPDVIVIKENNGMLDHSKKGYVGNYTLDNKDVFHLDWHSKYIANESDEPLIFYPAYYGPHDKQGSVIEKEPIIIEPHSIVKVSSVPDKYFDVPDNQILLKSDAVEERWILDQLQTVATREGWFDECQSYPE